uniref:phosphoserine phosphatase n=1 Tax=Candidatus Kentrum sp. MB TaxID=2138164 RepID=A0A450XE41_9GAMM|nr:MAG: phosphoserine phosphatase [Candidatus Kentron sp. MB]VFK32770.1 MAG: phosphoserine phosphatase [Candidatus Kentron sp. MB]VFK74351.1 MAG: phosphoserine phosphatase [Candidatus Kentron sp. MB]
MEIACLDLEGVLVPEVWIGVAERTGISELRVTTRDIPDYDVLMRQRLSIMEKHGMTLGNVQEVIGTMEPLDGAPEFLDWLRTRFQVIILSDTFYEFSAPLMRKLNWPVLFCNYLETDGEDRVIGYRLRQPDQKRQAIKALHTLNFRTIAAGDSYNDTTMLAEADAGIFFRPPEDIARQFPQYPVTRNYEELRTQFQSLSVREI